MCTTEFLRTAIIVCFLYTLKYLRQSNFMKKEVYLSHSSEDSEALLFQAQLSSCEGFTAQCINEKDIPWPDRKPERDVGLRFRL